MLFTIGSLFSVFTFLIFTPLLQKFGNTRLVIYLALLDILSLVIMGATTVPIVAITSFLVFLAVNPLIFLNIDIYAECIIGEDEGVTGTKRGITLTLMSVAGLLAPLFMGFLTKITPNISYVYYAAASFFTLFIIFILLRFRTFIDPIYTQTRFRHTLKKIITSKDIRNVCFSHFLLQMFFAWMVIYVPLYMVTVLGLSWHQIGNILAVAMFAYVLLEYPVGYLADKYVGEKEFMAVGFMILAVSSSWLAFITQDATILTWMVVMFATRVGAALVETTTESYFFKHTDGSDADLINFFRILRPLSNVFGALAGSLCLILFPFQFIFIILGLMMVPGLFVTMSLTDTK